MSTVASAPCLRCVQQHTTSLPLLAVTSCTAAASSRHTSHLAAGGRDGRPGRCVRHPQRMESRRSRHRRTGGGRRQQSAGCSSRQKQEADWQEGWAGVKSKRQGERWRRHSRRRAAARIPCQVAGAAVRLVHLGERVRHGRVGSRRRDCALPGIGAHSRLCAGPEGEAHCGSPTMTMRPGLGRCCSMAL